MGEFGRQARRRVGNVVRGAGLATRADVRRLQAELQKLRAAHDDRLEEVGVRVGELERGREELEERAATLEALARIDGMRRFIRHVPPRSESLVSVILPTYERPDELRRAIDSVRGQRYEHWELLVIDDGSETDSRAVAEQADDERVRWTRIEHQGVGTARNAGLRAAQGEIIAYLDDDNIMDPEWLVAVVWAFEQQPECNVLYGAFVVDDVLRIAGRGSGHLPRVFLRPWSEESLRLMNLADMGAIAHRSGLPEARFDESLVEMHDWDLLLKLTAAHEPLVLPAIACYYTTDGPNRLSGGPTHDADLDRVLGRE